MALDSPSEGKQCSHHSDKFWHMQGVRISHIKFITRELNLLLLRKLITFKEINYGQYSNSQGHWDLSEGFLLFVLLALVVGRFFSVKIEYYRRKKTEFNCQFLEMKPPDAFVRTLAGGY